MSDRNGNGHVPDPLAHLSAPHLADLRRSGLTDPTIVASGVKTVKEPSVIGRYLGWSGGASKLGECLGFPYRTPDGGRTDFVRFRPDRPRRKGKKTLKYESPLNTPLRVYFSPTATTAALADPSVPLCVVEGEKKTLRVAQEGFVAVGVAGVWAWQLAREEGDGGKKQGPRQQLPDFDLIQLAGRLVYLLFDSDSADNPKAGWGVYHLGALLQSRGADVRVVVLPSGPPGEDGQPAKCGADDFLLTHTVEDLRALMAEAKPPAKPEPDTAMEADDDPHRLARLLIEQNRRHDLDTIRFWREEFHKWAGAAYRRLPDKEVGAMLTACAKAEFDRLNIEAQKERKRREKEGGGGEGKKTKLKPARKVTLSLTGNMRQAMTDLCLLPSTVLAPAWLTPEDEWDPADVLACRNGLLHLPSLVSDKDHLIAPTPLFFSPNALDYDFSFDAPPCWEWLKFLNEIWPDDPASVETLQEWFGYCLLPNTRQQKIMMMVGPPRSGKGTVGRVLRRLIGEANVCSPTLSSLAGAFGLQPLLGKTLAIISDARLTRRTDLAPITERLLSISGEDGQTVERKHMSAVDCKLPVRFCILTNELPKLTDSSGALVSRMVLLRLTSSWLGREDTRLTDRLLAESPSVLLWAIEGWRRLRERGCFLQPVTGRSLMKDMENLSSPVGAFVRECCMTADSLKLPVKDVTVPVRDLFARWKEWCEEKGEKRPGDEMMFGRNMHAAVPRLEVARPRIQGTDNKGPREYRGVRLKTQDELDAAGAEEAGE